MKINLKLFKLCGIFNNINLLGFFLKNLKSFFFYFLKLEKIKYKKKKKNFLKRREKIPKRRKIPKK